MPETDADINQIINIAKICAQVILENGGETYRAEESVGHICRSLGFPETEVIALTTGVFISVCKDNVNYSTAVKRIKKRSVNLSIINEANDISRKLTSGQLSLQQAEEKLKELAKPQKEKVALTVIAAGLSSGFFSLLFGGSVYDFIASTIIGIIVQYVASTIKIEDMFNVAVSTLGGMIIGLGAVIWVRYLHLGNMQMIITGAMMPLLPGLAMTNSIRDTMRGDLISGVARGAEALLVALSIAFGVGVVLKLFYLPG